jgi:hypothetical protein
MNKLSLICGLLVALAIKLPSQSFYAFPSKGWTQTLLYTEFTGHYWYMNNEELTYTHDSTFQNNKIYHVLELNSQEFYTRSENGKIYKLENISDTAFTEKLLYDFSLQVGDTVKNIFDLPFYTYTVIKKEKRLNLSQDSLWYMEIKIHSLHPDTIRWMEGIGDLRDGLLKFYFPDAGLSHICTRNRKNQTIYASPEAPYDCNCDYIHGQDKDDDGYRNQLPIWKYIELNQSDWPPQFFKRTKHRECDTLVIFNYTGYSVDVQNADTDEPIVPDSATGNWEQLFYYQMNDVKDILITHQFANIYYNINILGCEFHDCNDLDSTVHTSHIEIPYNGIDNDCDPETPDDDLDHDGYLLSDDCDDTNASIHPGLIEFIYNGLDDDCNPETPDDDLDFDGYTLAEDCDDANPGIYPGALEIPNNGIDEDCNGNDLTTSVFELSNAKITIYPNPVNDILYIDNNKNLDLQLSLFDISGIEMKFILRDNEINVKELVNGIYLLIIRDKQTNQSIREMIVVAKEY